MRVSTRARYALRMMADVARNGGESEPVSLGAVAGRTEISRSYLEQVALSLRAGGLLRSVSGRNGGYVLTSPAAEITIGRIVETLIGPICLVRCIDDPACCTRSENCEFLVLYRLINNRIVEVLKDHTLADLIDPEWLRVHGGTPAEGVVEWLDGGQTGDCC